MDKIGIKNIINNPATKFDEALKQKARQHLREEIRKELRALQYEQNNVDSRNILDQTFESNPLYNHEAISQAVLEQIRRKFGIDFLLEATSNESHANNNFLETALINSTTNLNMDKESDLVNNNSNIKSTRDISFVADSTSNLNTNEEIIPFITPINEDLNTINSCESSVNTEIVSTNTSPNTQRRNSFKANNSSLSESSDLNINFSENTLESAKLESKNCSRINEQPIIMKKEFIKLSPKSMEEKLKLLPDRPSTSKITHRNKVKSSPLKKPSKIGFKENEILIIDSSSSSSNDDSSSSESSSESDSNSSSNSSSSNSERNKKITNRKKPHKKRLEAAVINRFRRLVLPNLSKYLQKKFEERYSKSSNNSTINFIYDICLSKIFKNSSLTQSAKKILKTNLKSLKQQEFLQFLFDNMKDLFLLSSQDKHTNEVLGSPSSKFMENFSASKIIPEINTETSNIVASETNQLESTSLSICDNDKNDNDSVNNSKDFCIPQKDSPNKPTIQFDKKSLNLIANELKNFSEQIKVLMTEKQINSQSSENLPLSSSNVDEMKEKNSSSASCENLVHIEEKSENEFSTLNSNRISSIKNNSMIENQTSNNFDDSNTATTLGNFNLTICNNVKENQDNTIDDNGINNENNNIEEAFSNENVDKAKISNSVNATSTKISIKQENCGNRNDSVLQKEDDLLNENKEHGNNEQIIKKYDEKELSSTKNEDNLDNRAENSENNSNHLRENHENNFGDECEKNEYQKVTKDLLIATSSPLQHFMELSEPENDSTKYNNDQNIPSDNELQRKNDYISSRLWKSPGEKKCIEFSSEETTDNALTPEIKNDKNENIKDSKSNSNKNSETPDTSTTTTSLDFTNSNNLRENSKNPSLVCTNETESVAENTFEETVVNNLKEIDLKLLELHKRKMFVEEMILKLQKDKMEIDFASMQLQNEKFLIMNATVTKSNICNSQKNPLLTFQTYLNSTNNMMNEPLSASDYISNMFANNQKSIPVTPTTKRKRPDSQSSSTSGSSPTKKMCTRRRLSISGDNDGSETDENSKKASTSNTIKGTHSETYKSPERNEKHKVKSKSETSTTKKKSTVKEKQSDNKGTNKSKKNNTSIETNNFNDDEEEIELSRELLKESKTCKNGPFLGTKLMITQIKVFEKFVIASSQDGNIYKYCWKTKELLGKFSKHTESVTQIHIDKNNCVYSISLDGFMRKTSIEKFGLEMLAVNLEEPLQSIDVAWHTVFVGTKWGNVFSYDLLESKISDLFEYSANNTIVGVIATKLSTNQNLKILIVTSKSNQIEIVNASNGHSIKIIETSQNPKIFSTLSNEGILYYCSTKNEINKFNIKTNCKLAAITCATKESIIFIKLIKKILLFVGCNDGSIYVINKRTGKEIHKYKLCENLITAIDFFGEKVIFASKDNRMVMEDLPSCISSYKHY
ncbi:putative uncharacterized protein DDB_G0282133 isoform X2 [Condylostylus longicornis]|nr:putative uncharacterized protein DDB_G0282133 isoform X2 [Condylostylus longicornis]